MPAQESEHGHVVVGREVREDGEEADHVEVALPHRQQLEAAKIATIRVVQGVVGVERVKLESRVGDVGLEPVDEISRDIDPGVAADRHRVVEQRLRKLGPAPDVEQVDSGEVLPSERAAKEVHGEQPFFEPFFLTEGRRCSLEFRRNGKRRCHGGIVEPHQHQSRGRTGPLEGLGGGSRWRFAGSKNRRLPRLRAPAETRIRVTHERPHEGTTSRSPSQTRSSPGSTRSVATRSGPSTCAGCCTSPRRAPRWRPTARRWRS